MNIAELKDCASMERLADEWQALADAAAEPNPFYEPWALLPAFQFLARGGRHATLITIRAPDGGGELLGVFPIAARCGYHHLPLRYRGLWRHPHCFLGTPLMKAGRERAVWLAFLEWIGDRSLAFDAGLVAADGPVFRGLRSAIARTSRVFETVETHRRPLLQPRTGGDDYINAALRGKRRRQFEKKLESLSRSGPVAFEKARDAETISRWAGDFIELEGRGWKGRGHTALRGRRNEEEFFRTFLRRGAERGSIRAYRLAQQGDALALRFDLIAQHAAFAFKIAYDERYARSSPGALLEIEVLRDFFAEGELRFVDSCTIPSPHSVHGLFWSEKRAISSLMIAAPTTLGRAAVSFGRLIRRVKGGRRERVEESPTGEAPALS